MRRAQHEGDRRAAGVSPATIETHPHTSSRNSTCTQWAEAVLYAVRRGSSADEAPEAVGHRSVRIVIC